MPFETVQLGSAPAGAGGDDNRTAFTRINSNFAGIKSRGLDEYMGADVQSGSVLAGYPTGKYYFASTCSDLPVSGVGIYVDYVKRYFSSIPSEYYVEASTNHATGPRKFINRTSGGVWLGWTEILGSQAIAGGWNQLTLLNGWTNYGNGFPVAAYRKTALGIQFSGMITAPAGGGPADTNILSFPAIGNTQIVVVPYSVNNSAVHLYAHGSGYLAPRVPIAGGNWLSLENILVPTWN